MHTKNMVHRGLKPENILMELKKDGNMYVLIKNLNIISEENIDNLKEILYNKKKKR